MQLLIPLHELNTLFSFFSKFRMCGGVDVVCGVVMFLKVESQMSPSTLCTATVKFIEPTQGAPIMIEVYDLF